MCRLSSTWNTTSIKYNIGELGLEKRKQYKAMRCVQNLSIECKKWAAWDREKLFTLLFYSLLSSSSCMLFPYYVYVCIFQCFVYFEAFVYVCVRRWARVYLHPGVKLFFLLLFSLYIRSYGFHKWHKIMLWRTNEILKLWTVAPTHAHTHIHKRAHSHIHTHIRETIKSQDTGQ